MTVCEEHAEAAAVRVKGEDTAAPLVGLVIESGAALLAVGAGEGVGDGVGEGVGAGVGEGVGSGVGVGDGVGSAVELAGAEDVELTGVEVVVEEATVA